MSNQNLLILFMSIIMIINSMIIMLILIFRKKLDKKAKIYTMISIGMLIIGIILFYNKVSITTEINIVSI